MNNNSAVLLIMKAIFICWYSYKFIIIDYEKSKTTDSDKSNKDKHDKMRNEKRTLTMFKKNHINFIKTYTKIQRIYIK